MEYEFVNVDSKMVATVHVPGAALPQFVRGVSIRGMNTRPIKRVRVVVNGRWSVFEVADSVDEETGARVPAAQIASAMAHAGAFNGRGPMVINFQASGPGITTALASKEIKMLSVEVTLGDGVPAGSRLRLIVHEA